MSVPPFIDWVHVFQRHNTVRAEGGDVTDAPFPVVASGVRITDVWDREGPVESFLGLVHEGSHSSKVWLRSDGSNVELSGNPGRFGRPDNVFNLGWEETLDVSNRLLAARGLPAFSAGEVKVKDSVSAHDAQRGLFEEWTGARVSELHVTKNYFTGSPEVAREVIRFWASQSKARLRKGRLGDETVVFGSGASTHQVECYIKAPEMLAHAKGEDAKRAMQESELYQWCHDTGLVRIEVKAKRGYLRNRGMNFLGGVNMDKVINLFDKATGFLLDARPDQLARVADQLPRKLRKYALLWLSGYDLQLAYSRATVFRIAKELREYGLDITTPRKVAGAENAVQELDKLLSKLPSFELVEAAAPSWYCAESEWGKAA